LPRKMSASTGPVSFSGAARRPEGRARPNVASIARIPHAPVPRGANRRAWLAASRQPGRRALWSVATRQARPTSAPVMLTAACHLGTASSGPCPTRHTLTELEYCLSGPEEDTHSDPSRPSSGNAIQIGSNLLCLPYREQAGADTPHQR